MTAAHASYRYLTSIAMFYVSALIISNIAAYKIITVAHIVMPAGLVIFPLSFILDDILTEVYGYQQSRLVIWTGMACNILFVTVIMLTIALPAAPFWYGQAAYHEVLGLVPRIVCASLISYFCGAFLNSYLLAKLKVKTKGRYYWLRLMVGSGAGTGIDSVLFCSLAFAFILPWQAVMQIAVSQYALKFSYEILLIPVTYKITGFLKRVEQVDYYDYHTHFSPFRFK